MIFFGVLLDCIDRDLECWVSSLMQRNMNNWYKISFTSSEVHNGKPEELEREYLLYQDANANLLMVTAAMFKTRDAQPDGGIDYFLTPDCGFYFGALLKMYDYEMSGPPNATDVVPAIASLNFDVTQLLSPNWVWRK